MSTVREETLENGLTVLIRENHAAPVVSVWAGYRVGARNERPGITGASHWVEHMTFKGTRALGKGDIFRLTARHGGANNGFTSDDTTVYYETLPAHALDLALQIEAERMAHALFDPEETERERTVILAERDGLENNPHYLLSERMGEAVFRVHPYRCPVIGTREDLQRMTREELLGHYRAHYVPANAALVVVGDVETEAALERVRHWFGDVPAGPPPPAVAVVEPPQDGERRVEVRRSGGAPYLQVGYRTPAFGNADAYPLVMLDALMSGARGLGFSGGGYLGRTARLYRALVETRLASSAGSGFRLMRDPYTFGASLSVREGVAPEEAETALRRTLEGVAAQPPSREELDRVLRQTEALVAYSRDGVSGQAGALLLFHLLDHWSGVERHLERLRAVTPEDVSRVAAAYLRPDNCTVGWLLPEDGAPPARAAAPASAPQPAPPVAGPGNGRSANGSRPSFPSFHLPREPRREVLENGLVLLAVADPETEVVSLRGTFPAGAAREAPEQAGLAGLTARLLRRGTERRSAQEIAEAVEAVGASFAVWGASEEAGFSARCLGRDLPRVLEVLQEVLERPAFAEAELEKTRGELRNHFKEQEDSTRSVAERALLGALYPAGHPYARFASGTRETVDGLRTDDLHSFHRAYYAAPGMRVSVAGAFEPDAVRRSLGGWFRGRPAPPALPDLRVAPNTGPSRAFLSLPHKSQVDIIMAGPGVPREHPDFFALSLVNLILGGLGLMGRLGERVREQRGIAYHASCRAVSRLWAGEWTASAGVAPEHVEDALEAVLAEVRRVREELLTEEELQDARDFLIGSLPLRMETNDGIAGFLLSAEYYGLGLDYLDRYPGLVLAETRESLREAARTYMDPDRCLIAAAGPVQ